MRVAYISPAFIGHVSVLLPLWRADENSHLFILCFKGDNIKFLNNDTTRVTIIRWNQPAPSEIASIFNHERAKVLTDILRIRLYDFRPTTIVYDFFCIEAHGLGIPSICSIPATLKEHETTTCSDALLLKENLYWLWKHPYPVDISPVQFMGPRKSDKNMVSIGTIKTQRLVVVCFGTVVPTYPGCNEKLLQQLTIIAQSTFDLKSDTTFALINLKTVVTTYNINVSPNTILLDYVDLVDLFDTYHPNLFIFHGGGNSYTEAYDKGIPMLVTPFFGDQFETLRRVGYEFIDTESIVNVLDTPQNARVDTFILNEPFTDDFSTYWKRGDLLYGHRRHRQVLQFNYQSINLHLEHFAPFHSFAHYNDLPAIADVYNDDVQFNSVYNTEYGLRLQDVYDVWSQKPLVEFPVEHKLVHYCIDILELAIKKWGSTIHFVLGPMNELGPATRLELDYILSHTSLDVLFYNLDGLRIPTPIERPMKIRNDQYNGEPIDKKGYYEARKKTINPMDTRRLPVLDLYGYRNGYIDLDDLLPQIPQRYDISVLTCDLRVHYYYQFELKTEIQLWPWIYLHNFHRDIKGGKQADRDYQRKAQNILSLWRVSKSNIQIL